MPITPPTLGSVEAITVAALVSAGAGASTVAIALFHFFVLRLPVLAGALAIYHGRCGPSLLTRSSRDRSLQLEAPEQVAA